MRDRNIVIDVPVSMFDCGNAPIAPDSTTATQVDVAAFIPRLYGWGQTCKDNLTAVQDFLVKEKALVEKDNPSDSSLH